MNTLKIRWEVFFILLPFMDVFISNSIFRNIFFLGTSVCVIKGFFILIKNKKIPKYILMIIIYFLFNIISCIFNNTLTLGILYKNIAIVMMAIYISYRMKDYKEVIHGLSMLFSILILINFISILLDKDMYFLGGKNTFVMIILPGISIIILDKLIRYKQMKVKHMWIIYIGILSLLIAGGGTTKVVGILLIGFIVSNKLFKFNNLMYLYSMIFTIVIFLNSQDNKVITWIVDVLDKDITFTGRTYIWNEILTRIKDIPLFGWGQGNNILNNVYVNNGTLTEAHNGILEILMNTGFIGLIIFIFLITNLNTVLKKNENNKIINTISFSVFCYMIIGLMESVFMKTGFWILIIIGFESLKIVNLESI